ncbi:hypothetical protein AURDEDRAFT_188163 [Auricularia subglabra TFB-10046 SS5]|uniref:N-acetyltransferase domain-containing protein n=1 Tax=Auricularia subglabra (strain TFB-10046 / SS5) TaxID=717982 RepID=J0WVH1_AURST|nr:hypothetical protein AURDEDRAFT_188163 [Auricularia subglabra TFB-10046 SS5]
MAQGTWNFVVRRAAEHDVDAIAQITLEAFQKVLPYLRPLAASDPDGFLASSASRSHEVIRGEKGPDVQWLVAVEQETQEVAAIAKWDRIANLCATDFVPATSSAFGGPPQVDFYNHQELVHRRIMGDRPHYWLHILATRPSFQRTGAASALLRNLTETADTEQLLLYLEAAPGSLPVYQKFGWTAMESLSMPTIAGLPDASEVVMLRQPYGGRPVGH